MIYKVYTLAATPLKEGDPKEKITENGISKELNLPQIKYSILGPTRSLT